MKISKKQKGFTIIELVVVILLLGILTATALPRFMDVTDDAHTSVVQGVVSGLSTGVALYRAQWYAKGQPTTGMGASLFGNIRPNNVGYPMGLFTGAYGVGTVSSIGNSTDCVEIFQNLLQTGGQPTIAAETEAATAYTAVTDLAAGNDFVAYNDTQAANDHLCYYFYTGQYNNVTAFAIPVIEYDTTDGSVETILAR